MKHFKSFISKIFTAGNLAVVFPLLLIIPNIILAFTEADCGIGKATDIILPLGVYYLFMSLSSRSGLTVLCCLPLMVLAAFQIVLLYLYGESIIAIDMFLNVVTTNSKEVSELLSNLIVAIITILIIYLPPIVWAIYLTATSKKYPERMLPKLRITGGTITLCGAICLAICYISVSDYTIGRSIFPVNVINNMIEAGNRTIATANYQETCSSFRYDASPSHTDSIKEVYVLVIGETSRADNWQLFGYERNTNPKLSKRQKLVTFPKALSESNTTHKSVPMLLSPLSAENFGDSIYLTKGLLEAFNEAGFETHFFSNQQRNHSFIDFFAEQAKETEFIKDHDENAIDMVLAERVKRCLDTSESNKILIVLHSYGSHFNYRERYDKTSCRFLPDDASEASVENRSELINAYDNSIIYTDLFLDKIIDLVNSTGSTAAVVYTSDHGEDIFDDSRGRFLHASPTPTFTQIHVPILIWTSDEYNSHYPQKALAAIHNSTKNASSSKSIFHTLISLAGIYTKLYDSHADLCSDDYTEPSRLYLNDYNEGVTLLKSGFKKIDTQRAKKANIHI